MEHDKKCSGCARYWVSLKDGRCQRCRASSRRKRYSARGSLSARIGCGTPHPEVEDRIRLYAARREAGLDLCDGKGVLRAS